MKMGNNWRFGACLHPFGFLEKIEYKINAEKSPDTGEWVLAGYWAVP